MITMEELTRGSKPTDISLSQMANLNALLVKLNKIRTLYKKPMYVTSGFRSVEKHLQIYKNLKQVPPMKSNHLSGNACDFSDPNGELMFWCQTNEPKLAEIGLWIEKGTDGWVHFQSQKYGSWKPGKSIFFYP